MRVLVVEDDASCRLILALLLEREGWQVVQAENGAVAYARGLRESFDLVITDIRMPVMNGLETIAALRALGRYRQVPFLAVTALAFDADREAILAAGFDGVVIKPFGRRQVLDAIARLLPGPETSVRTA